MDKEMPRKANLCLFTSFGMGTTLLLGQKGTKEKPMSLQNLWIWKSAALVTNRSNREI